MSGQEKHLYQFGPFRLDPVKRRLLRDGEPVPLTPKAFDTLLALVARGPRVRVTRPRERAAAATGRGLNRGPAAGESFRRPGAGVLRRRDDRRPDRRPRQ